MVTLNQWNKWGENVLCVKRKRNACFSFYSDPMRPLFLPIKLFTVPLCVRFNSFEFSWFFLFCTRRARNSREYSPRGSPRGFRDYHSWIPRSSRWISVDRKISHVQHSRQMTQDSDFFSFLAKKSWDRFGVPKWRGLGALRNVDYEIS